MQAGFIDAWFDNPKWWFSATPDDDAYITNNFGHLLSCSHDGGTTVVSPLEAVLIYDQLPRHVFRQGPDAHIIEYFLQKALNILSLTPSEYLDGLSNSHWCFMMLPYRHSNDMVMIFSAMKMAWARPLCPHIKRFLKASYQRCPTTDQSRHLIYYPPEPLTPHPGPQFASILEPGGPQASGRGEPQASGRESIPHSQYGDAVILSISGGKDSMLCSKLYGPFRAAVHINYKNRETSDQEEAFVRAWCSYLGIPLYVRRIHEIQRGPCMENEMREVYERYTRDVRYGTYKTVAATFSALPTVMLGHNKDDCLENLFTNVAHKAHYDNLLGMTEISSQDGIQFVRPLLSQSTEDIKSTLHALNIPHLPNSTPPWSQRGQIRANVVPVLDKWDPRFTGGFFKLSETMTSLYRILDRQVTQFCMQHAARGYVTLGDADTDTLIWKEVILRISGGHQTPKESALENMLARLQAFKKQSTHKTTKIVVSKTVIVHAKKRDSKIDISILTT